MRLIIGCALLLSSCGQKAGSQADDRICTTAPKEIVPYDMTSCVHKWAYRLAGSPDSAPVVAKAVVAACINTIGEDAERTSTQSAGHRDDALQQSFFSRNKEVMEEQALFRVVQARAGTCVIP